MRAPSHATVASYVALFMALGGSAYAATGGTFVLGHANVANKTTSLKSTGNGAALRLVGSATKPVLAVSNSMKISKLNADYLDGDNSSDFARKGYLLSAATTSADSTAQPVGPNGLWTFSISCAAGGPATLTVHGPGTIGGTISVATGTGAATTYIRQPVDIGSGYRRAATDGDELSMNFLLQDGTTAERVDVVMSASSGGLFENCTLFGNTEPIS